jgi:Uma2 family endonuclease
MSGLTYDDLSSIPQDDGLRGELIDGELYVTPPPVLRHQGVLLRIAAALLSDADKNGGLVLPAPTDVVFSQTTVVAPDVVFVGPKRVELITDHRFIDISPDLVIEVSSPTTRRLDLIKKRNLYEREGVLEFWFVDLEVSRVDVHRLDAGGHYGAPTSLGPDATLHCLSAPQFVLPVGEALSR